MREVKQLKAVIFDMDGTLLNTLDDLMDSMNHVLAQNGYPTRNLAEIRSFVGNGVKKLVSRSMGFADDMIYTEDQTRELDRLFDEMKEYYGAHSQIKTAPYAGVTDIMCALKEHGLKMAIVSNKVDPAVKDLNEQYFAEWISVAIGDQEGYQVKPASDLLQLAMKELGVTAEECLYVGDSEVDILTAKNAGMPGVMVTWGFRDPDFLLEQGAGAMVDTPEQVVAKILEQKAYREKNYQYLLFDLDGTLTNPEEGITKSVQYSLASFGIEADRKDLLCFIGPPLWDSFMNFYGMSKEEADRAVAKYRERYVDIGVYENYAYEGVGELLQRLKELGYLLGVATSKPEIMAHKVLEKYELAEYFDVICGSELDGRRAKKSEVIEETLRRFSTIDRKQVLMIGDTKFDIRGAKEAGMDSCGVYYGFAEPGDLEVCGAEYVVRTVRELYGLLCGE